MLLNIVGTRGDKNDPSFRYKMPKMITKIEGKGNGIKTNLVNCTAVAAALHRTPSVVTKFFGTEFGAISKFDAGTLISIVNGAHENKTCQETLDKFIDIFVLCPNCHLPETDLCLEGKKKNVSILHNCKACGSRTPVDLTHRLCATIIKELSPDSAADKKDKKAKKDKKDEEKEGSADVKKEKKPKKEKQEEEKDGGEKKKKSKKEGDKKVKKDKKKKKEKERESSSGNEQDRKEDAPSKGAEEDWGSSSDESAAPIVPPISAAIAPLPAPTVAAVPVSVPPPAPSAVPPAPPIAPAPVEEGSIIAALAAFAEVNRSTEELLEEARRSAELIGSSPLRLIVLGACSTAPSRVVRHRDVLEALATEEGGAEQLLAAFEEVLAGAQMPLTAVYLKNLYDAELAEEQDFKDWACNQATIPGVDAAAAAAIRAKAAPFLRWLEEAEEEDSDQDSEEDQ